jgi:hypothetical protein
MVRWLRLLVLMWLLVRIDDSWDLVIIGGYDTEQTCRLEQERSLWGPRVFCAPAKTRTLLLSGPSTHASPGTSGASGGSAAKPPTSRAEAV